MMCGEPQQGKANVREREREGTKKGKRRLASKMMMDDSWQCPLLWMVILHQGERKNIRKLLQKEREKEKGRKRDVGTYT